MLFPCDQVHSLSLPALAIIQTLLSAASGEAPEAADHPFIVMLILETWERRGLVEFFNLSFLVTSFKEAF